MIDLESVQRFALHAVEKGDWEYTYRKICRWYSKTFSTPLHTVVYDLDQEEILQHYFENQIESMKSAAEDLEAKADVTEAWVNFRSAIINGYQETAAEEVQQAEEDDNWALEMKKIIAEEEKAEKAKQTPKVTSKQTNHNLYDADTIFGKDVEFDTPPDYE